MTGAGGFRVEDRPAGNSERPAFVALIGAPRSGTTWLQSLLASHELVVSPQETNLFSRYLAPLDDRWRHEARGTLAERQQRRFIGLGAVLTEAQFHDELARVADDVIAAITTLKPGATIVLEKTPSHSLHVELIARTLPHVRFVHLVRDGRDSAASLVAASQGWGAAWGAPRSVSVAARIWRDHVQGARRAEGLAPYLELSYETLRDKASAATALQEVFAFCGVEVSLDDAEARLVRFAIDRQRSGERGIVIGGEAARYEAASREPEGFVRGGERGGWNAWPVRDRVDFAHQAGELLRDLGYATDDRWIGPRLAVRRARVAASARRGVGRIDRALASRMVQHAARIDP